jgi:hypothetical protein
MTMDWSEQHPHTPDGRYFVVRGRLWRLADPSLDPALKSRLVLELMVARRALRKPVDGPNAMLNARLRVDVAKRALGELVALRHRKAGAVTTFLSGPRRMLELDESPRD